MTSCAFVCVERGKVWNLMDSIKSLLNMSQHFVQLGDHESAKEILDEKSVVFLILVLAK